MRLMVPCILTVILLAGCELFSDPPVMNPYDYGTPQYGMWERDRETQDRLRDMEWRQQDIEREQREIEHRQNLQESGFFIPY